MNRRLLAPLALLAIPLMGAGQSTGFYRAGQWETRFEIIAASMLGLETGAERLLDTKPVTDSWCMTEERAGNSTPESLFQEGDDACTFRDLKKNDGRLNATMVCRDHGYKSVTKMSGSYTADRVDYEAEKAIRSATDPSNEMMTIKFRVSIRRTGDCSK